MPEPVTHRRRAGRLLWKAAALLFAGVVISALAWQFWKSHRGHDSARPVAVIVSGDTAGWIVPCGCTSNQSGGLLRRGSYVQSVRREADVLLLDAGGAPGGTAAYQREKFSAILQGEMAMGIAAHNLGGPEAALGADYLRRLAQDESAPFVSANLRDRQGDLVTAPSRLIERNGRRFLVIGVLSRRYAAGGVTIDEPREAILRALSSAGAHDSVIILAYLPEDELRQVAAALPEADLIMGGPTGQSISPTSAGPAWIASATNKGKFLVHMQGTFSSNRFSWTGQVVEMDRQWSDEPQQQENYQRYLEKLARLDFPANETGLATPLPADLPKDYRLAGDHACAQCHSQDAALASETGHAHAWQTLAERKAQADPSCQQCHTTGYGLPGGFQSMARTPEAVGVRCESCHGPALAHSRRPEVRTPFAAADQCRRCHDHENSPAFDFATYWPRIKHGSNKDKKNTAEVPR
jgi:Cytochrome c554 and c-prime